MESSIKSQQGGSGYTKTVEPKSEKQYLVKKLSLILKEQKLPISL